MKLHITLREDCLLKAARVFMIFEVLEKIGEVIKSVPAVDQLEEEQFDSIFMVTVISKESQEDIEKKIMKVSEVEKVDVHALNFETLRVASIAKADAIVSENQQEQPTVAKPEKATTEEKKQPLHKSSSSKTIRVNIERLDILMNLFEELVIDRGRLDQISHDLDNPELTGNC